MSDNTDNSLISTAPSEDQSNGINDDHLSDPNDELPIVAHLAPSDIPNDGDTNLILDQMTAADATITAGLRETWGEEAPLNIAYARAATQAFGTRELDAVLDGASFEGVPLGSHPAVIDVAARIGRMFAKLPGDPSTIAASPSSPASDALAAVDDNSVRQRIDEIHALEAAPDGRRSYRSKRVQVELRRLYRRLYGDEPYVSPVSPGD